MSIVGHPSLLKHRLVLALWLLVVPLLTAGVPPAAAQDTGAASRLESIAGLPPERARAFLAELQRAVSVTDRLAVCALVRFPLNHPDGPVVDAAACRRRYAEIFTAGVIEAVKRQLFDDLFVNAQGVMIGDGEVWFAAVCEDRSCSRSEPRVITVNTAKSAEPRR